MEAHLKDHTGRRFGRLLTLGLVERDQSGKKNHKWRFRCDCGNIAVLGIRNVTRGTKSCGCLQRESFARVVTTHGKSRVYAKEYKTWKSMRQRCLPQNAEKYPEYAGRGITVDPKWDDFNVFLTDMGACPANKSSIDRINNDGNYEPGNCRWADVIEQANNKRTSHKIAIADKVQTLTLWCRETNTPLPTAKERLARGEKPATTFRGRTPLDAVTILEQDREVLEAFTKPFKPCVIHFPLAQMSEFMQEDVPCFWREYEAGTAAAYALDDNRLVGMRWPLFQTIGV